MLGVDRSHTLWHASAKREGETTAMIKSVIVGLVALAVRLNRLFGPKADPGQA